MSEENKVITMCTENGKFRLCVDPNKDGQPVVCIEVDISEIPDEVVSAIANR